MTVSDSTILALDLGTTNFKAMVVDSTGRVMALVRLPAPVQKPHPGWSQIQPGDFLTCLAELIASLKNIDARILANVAALTFASQTNSFLLLDDLDQPLTPIILWNDTRAAGSVHSLLDRIGALPDRYAVTGVPTLGEQFMFAKLDWLHQQDPALGNQATRLCLLSDWFTLLLTGKHLTEAGAAGLTGLVDIHNLDWWEDGLSITQIPRTWLPQVVRAGFDAGPILGDKAKQHNLPTHCRFIIGCLDQYAGAIGLGNVTPGQFSETTGTVLATVRCSDRFDPQLGDVGILQSPGFEQNVYYQMVFGDISANLLQLYRDAQPDRPTFAQLDRLAGDVPHGAQGLSCTGINNGQLQFTGRTENHSRAHEVRAILEAVAKALRDQVALLSQGDPPTQIHCAGGAARSELWQQIKTDTLGFPAIAANVEEPTCYGAAMIAARALTGKAIPQLARSWY